MAESAGKRSEQKEEEEKPNEEEVKKNEEDEEKSGEEEKVPDEPKKKKGGAVPKKCSTCRMPLRGHNGPPGKRCKNKNLIQFHEEDEGADEDKEEDEGVQECESEDSPSSTSTESSEESTTDSSDSEEEAYRERRRKKRERRRRRKQRRSEQKKKNKKKNKKAGKETSTPRHAKKGSKRFPAFSFVAGNIDKTFVDAITERFDKMDAKMSEMERKWSNEVSRQSEKNIEMNSNSNTYQTREDIQMLSGVSDAQKELLDLGVVIQDTGRIHQTTVPGLRPVSEFSDVRNLKPHPGVSDKQIKQILQGEYCELPILLTPEIETINESKYEAIIEDGKFTCKVKETKRDITSIILWLEAWSLYEKIMLEYHGIQAFVPLYDYKMRVLAWYKKYTWASIYSWDMKVRQEKGNKSINFVEHDAALFDHHFDATTYKQKPKGKCAYCKEDHKGNTCPFQKEPGAGAGTGTGQRREGIGQYRYGAARPDTCYFFNTSTCFNKYCTRWHACKNCGGPSPYFECKYNGKCAYARN